MKRLILISGAILSMTSAFSQFNFGIQLTGNLGTAVIRDEADFDYNKSLKFLPGAGLVVEYGITEKFGIRSGVQYLRKGVNLKTLVDAESLMTIHISNQFDYLQVPVTLQYNLPGYRTQFYGGIGGYFSYGISGKSKATLRYTMPDGNEMKITESLHAFKNEEEGGIGFSRSDYGLTALAGARFQNGMFAQAGYQYGLADINKQDHARYRNHGIQLTVGYFFWNN